MTNNEIVFPAAVLQPPLFDYQADPAANYGGIGFAIGHEITHGFDLRGSQFDAEGNLGNWWTAADRERFEALNQDLIAQYGAIEVAPGLFVDGQITIRENAADLGGIATAYDALQIALAAKPDAATPVAGDGELALTPEQRFFVAAAAVWRTKVRDEALAFLVRTDEHAPSAVRATQPLRNMDEFYEAFGITEGDPMYLPPEERITIW